MKRAETAFYGDKCDSEGRTAVAPHEKASSEMSCGANDMAATFSDSISDGLILRLLFLGGR